ncbi:uncharacterized protein LOC21400680 [Morus notabilis]|uniref:uncharacterized protein LOC21400680 n=1 Tax=Morus notabilis TaxID=981085 RepID=UPI000CED0CCA|nr:uncharacterized protein LOC21400680 [Morus notabilis]
MKGTVRFGSAWRCRAEKTFVGGDFLRSFWIVEAIEVGRGFVRPLSALYVHLAKIIINNFLIIIILFFFFSALSILELPRSPINELFDSTKALFVMSKDSKALGVSEERNRDGPDYFGYYTCQVKELLSEDENCPPLTSQTPELPGRGFDEVKGDSLFSNGIGIKLSDFKREKLKTLLQQSAVVLNAEANEMQGSVIQTSGVQTQRRKKSLSRLSGAESEDDKGQPPSKKLKLCSSYTSTSLPRLSSAQKNSACRDNAEAAGPEESKVNDDLKFILENDSDEIDKMMMKLSDELSAKLGHMQQQLETLLDDAMSTCRPMTFAEKKQLQKMIKALPRENLDRVAELVKRGKRGDEKSDDDIHVDLEKENIVTLWRLYYYVRAIEKARKLSL